MIKKCDICNFMYPTELIYWNVSEDINYCSKCLKIKFMRKDEDEKNANK